MILVYYSTHRNDGRHYFDWTITEDEYDRLLAILPHDISWWIVPNTIDLEDC